MRSKLRGAILRAPVFKLFELALFLAAAALYVGAYMTAAHMGQVIAAVAVVIAILLVANQFPASDESD